MWIIINQHLPVENPPPYLSMFWSTPWKPDNVESWKQQIKRWLIQEGFVDGDEKKLKVFVNKIVAGDMSDENVAAAIEYLSTATYITGLFGKEPNHGIARRIHHEGRDIKVFPHEFSPLKAENMKEYIESGEFKLVGSDIAGDRMIEAVLESDQRLVYDAALVDGCIPSQAMLVALEMDVTLADEQFPPAVGWYKPSASLLAIMPGPITYGLSQVNHDRRAAAKAAKAKRKG